MPPIPFMAAAAAAASGCTEAAELNMELRLLAADCTVALVGAVCPAADAELTAAAIDALTSPVTV